MLFGDSARLYVHIFSYIKMRSCACDTQHYLNNWVNHYALRVVVLIFDWVNDNGME